MQSDQSNQIYFLFHRSPTQHNPKTMSLKAPTGLLSDEVIVLPAEAVEKSSGFALDIGKLNSIDSNLAVFTHVVFLKLGCICPKKLQFFQSFLYFSQLEPTKKYDHFIGDKCIKL